ncbi:MAG: enoyl-CoA hydratase-related protein [Pseudomonadota bacterium]|nr:enoyl-CoA hydratase-related protein [Pseudomonadota bacterium]
MSVTTDVQDDIAIIQFDDGNKNVINHELLDDLESAFDQTERSNAKVLILQGREGSFCAGYDLSVMVGDDPKAASRLGQRGGNIARRIYGSRKPVVGLSQGHAFTIGAIWLASCDLAVAEDGPYKYGMVEVALNVPLTGWALAPVQAKLHSAYHTKALMHAHVFNPSDAQEAGFIDQLASSGEGLNSALNAAENLAQLPTEAYYQTKLALRQQTLSAMDKHLG